MTEVQRLRTSIPSGTWIDNIQTDAFDGSISSVFDPATGDLVSNVADAGGKDALRALDAAAATQ